MSGSHDTLMTDPGDVRRLTQDLAWDLACASGTLSEIATCWRRALASTPEFSVSLPLRPGPWAKVPASPPACLRFLGRWADDRGSG